MHTDSSPFDTTRSGSIRWLDLPRADLRDPRWGQIAVLGSLLIYGLFGLGLDIEPRVAATILPSALACQWLLGRLLGVRRFDAKSPLISSLSLILLLRTRSPGIALAAACLTIGSKFLIRARRRGEDGPGKHVFNPTNFGLAAVLLLFDGAWVSPGQWGSGALLAFAAACLGLLVVHRAARSDVTWAFLAAWSAILLGRAAWLGDPWQIPLHQMQNGAFLIFAFFMISDPKTTPDSRAGRILYACAVAGLAAWIQFGTFTPNALIWSLVCLAPVVPLTDRLLPGLRYAWPGSRDDSSTLHTASPSRPNPTFDPQFAKEMP